MPSCVELFTGLGGLALGLDRAGFDHELLVESDPRAARTLASNRVARTSTVHAGDVRELDWGKDVSTPLDLLAAGVPCQPFSQAGVLAGPADERNMFPSTFDAVRSLRPKAVMIENVRGLAHRRFRSFLDYVVDALSVPYLCSGLSEGWVAHHARLRRALSRPPALDAWRYRVSWRLINTADYGVAQKRVRVIIVAVRADCEGEFVWPRPTHAQEGLLRDQLDGFYWRDHRLPPRSWVLKPGTRERLGKWPHPARLDRWRTVRDVIADLPLPVERDQVHTAQGHVSWPGARLYRGHRGSDLDLPSKTIKAGVHGVAGGEHIVRLDDGSFRYLTVRECMRIQDLPNELEIDAPRTTAMKQVGNAVPPRIGYVFGRALLHCIGRSAGAETLRMPHEGDRVAPARVDDAAVAA